MGVPPRERVGQQSGARESNSGLLPEPRASRDEPSGLSGVQPTLHHHTTRVLPRVQTAVPVSPIPVREESGRVGDTERPRTLRSDVPLRDQGWSRGDSGASSRPLPDPNRDPIRDILPGEPASEEAASPKKTLPPVPIPRAPRSSTDESQIYENLNPFTALRPGAAAGNQERGSGGARPRITPRSPQQATSPPQPAHSDQPSPKSILKKPNSPHPGKQVKYSPSTKGARPDNPRRAHTPDIDVSIRPTSALDILDEVLAGQPSKRKDGRTIPDTLIQVESATPPAGSKRQKKVVEPSDRILRSKKP